MSEHEYRIHYQSREDVVFPSKKGMQTYLKNEIKNWTAFLDYVRDDLKTSLSRRYGQTIKAEELALSLVRLLDRIEERSEFNTATGGASGRCLLPPPSDSLEGLLIRGLFDAEYRGEALASFVYFVSKGGAIEYRNGDRVQGLVQRGKTLVEVAPVVLALPYNNVSTAKIAGAARTAENHVDALSEEVSRIQEVHEKHEAELRDHLEEEKAEARRVHKTILRLNRRRDMHFKAWRDGTNKLVAERFDEAEKKVRLFELKSMRAKDARVEEFQRLQELFKTQLRLRAPVQLWEGREQKHANQARRAMLLFITVGVLAILFGLGVPFVGGDYIAASFNEVVCLIPASEGVAATETSPAIPASPASECERVFSAKGPVTVTGLLLVTSLLLWLARLQYRIHLSERHLALDASEKKAFAETYLAMKEGKEVGKENEAIILASLFRPTQDGIIKDDESGVDISAAALLAKQLGRL
ncbi:DUF6161 domain-containing protein [Aliiroseovarius sp.]|uniref:DUF6161 domain-containing protein n=1 Tax=Aliiroseovarius sp. TaxID=1872442 RepID=UPI003BA8BADD